MSPNEDYNRCLNTDYKAFKDYKEVYIHCIYNKDKYYDFRDMIRDYSYCVTWENDTAKIVRKRWGKSK